MTHSQAFLMHIYMHSLSGKRSCSAPQVSEAKQYISKYLNTILIVYQAHKLPRDTRIPGIRVPNDLQRQAAFRGDRLSPPVRHCPRCWYQRGSCAPPPPPPPPRRQAAQALLPQARLHRKFFWVCAIESPPLPPPRWPAAQALPPQARLRRKDLLHTQLVRYWKREAACAAAMTPCAETYLVGLRPNLWALYKPSHRPA